MTFQKRYKRRKAELLDDASICPANRELFREFFDYQEYKLKRQNQLSALDEPCYKTLNGYIGKFRNVNRWFQNKPWKELTREDIKGVYDDLEDGKIVNRAGARYEDRAGYYNKIFKSKPFRLAGKSEIVRDVIEFASSSPKQVRYITEDAFRTLVSVVSNPKHLLLLWLAWDIGENIGALLQLSKRNFMRQNNTHSGQPEYVVHLPQAKLKRSRMTRSEPTLHRETVRYADIVLRDLDQDASVFQFGPRHAQKIIQRARARSHAECMPDGSPPRWKDLRSGMACHLLKSGWSREQVDARLGHSPNSSALNAYINFLAIDRAGPPRAVPIARLTDARPRVDRDTAELLFDLLQRLTLPNGKMGS